MEKEKLLKLLKEAENNREKIKEKEVFHIHTLYIILILLIILASEIYQYYILKYTINYVSFIDFYTSPAMYFENFINFIILVFFLGFIIYNSVKINLAENYIKLKLNRKIYFDNIEIFEVRTDNTIEIIEKGGRKTEINTALSHYGKFLFIIKENLGEKFVIGEYPKYKKEQTFPIDILIIVLSLCALFIINKQSGKKIESYMYDADFSKYGIVREEQKDGEYAKINYKHGKKDGISRYFNKENICIRKITYAKNEKLIEKTYAENGILISTIDYLQGEKVIYYPDGTIFIKMTFDENGKVTSPLRIYDNMGNLRIEEMYRKSCDCMVWKIFANKTIIQKFSEERWKYMYTWKMHIPYYFDERGVLQEEIDMLNQILERCNQEK